MTPSTTVHEKTFAQLPLVDSLFHDIHAAGFVTPTPIQGECIPLALAGKDLIGLAQTGTGKTAAFAIPIIQKLTGKLELGALVLAPTRELAQQIVTQFELLGKSSGLRVACVVGGVPIDKDYKALHSWPNVLVATPGRLIDHLMTTKGFSLAEVSILVVDEADRMHDMGFIPQIRRILAALSNTRQTLMFTATMPKDVEQIARKSMRDPVRVQVGRCAPAQRARQQLFHVDEEQKTPLLTQLLQETAGRTLVFLRTKRGVDRLGRVLRARGLDAAVIHGDREQTDREIALNGFREGHPRILVATDIAARGIDVADIEHVVNYDFPHSPEDYIHRIGRTARVAASGLATSFVTGQDRRYFHLLEQLLGEKLPLINPSGGTVPVAEHPSEVQRPSGHKPDARHAAGQHGSEHKGDSSDRPRRRRGRGGRGGQGRSGGAQSHAAGHGTDHPPASK